MDWNGCGEGGPRMVTSRRWHLLRWEKFGSDPEDRFREENLKFCFEIKCMVAQAPFGAGKHEPA